MLWASYVKFHFLSSLFSCKRQTNISCWIPKDVDLYLEDGKKEMNLSMQNTKYMWDIGQGKNGLQDYKIYVMVIYMFDKDFLNNIR